MPRLPLPPVGRWVDRPATVPLAAAAAFLLRLPGLTRPVRADEAGFLLVARSWDPAADSLYGPYWVDRPPALIAVFDLADRLGGVVPLRLLGALACAALVFLAAWVAGLLAGTRASRWTAVVVAAVSTNAMVDVVAVKGELLGLPFVMGAIGLSLVALRRTSTAYAAAAGLVGATALGLKQNLAGGLVFGAVLLVGSVVAGRLHRRDLLRLGGAAAVGALVPVGATVGWALAAGVRLEHLWYAVYGFRTDAAAVIAEGSAEAPALRGLLLLSIAVAAGMALVVGAFLVHLRSEWTDDPVVVVAVLAVVTVDLAALVAGGSYWRDYLFPMVPGTALCAALVTRRAHRGGRHMRGVVTASALSSLVSLVAWAAYNAGGWQEFDEVRTGEAIAAAAEPGDTLVVFGGRADLQLASGLPSPYRHLWSLPMRTLDPDYAELRGLLAGPDAPTWLVMWVPHDAWDNRAGDDLLRTVEEQYVEHGEACDSPDRDRTTYLLRGLDRPAPAPSC